MTHITNNLLSDLKVMQHGGGSFHVFNMNDFQLKFALSNFKTLFFLITLSLKSFCLYHFYFNNSIFNVLNLFSDIFVVLFHW